MGFIQLCYRVYLKFKDNSWPQTRSSCSYIRKLNQFMSAAIFEVANEAMEKNAQRQAESNPGLP